MLKSENQLEIRSVRTAGYEEETELNREKERNKNEGSAGKKERKGQKYR